MKIEDVSALDIKGFLDHEEGMLLYDIARELSANGPCLEIGGYCGKSTVYLGLGCKARGGILFSIDHHRGSEEHRTPAGSVRPDRDHARTGRLFTDGGSYSVFPILEAPPGEPISTKKSALIWV